MQARAQRSPYCSSQGEAFSSLFSENLKTFRDGVKTAHSLTEAASGRAGNKRGSVPAGGHVLGGWPGKATAPAGLDFRESLNVPQSHRCHTPRSPTLASA